MKTEFLTPVGRLVQGDPFEAQTKNKAGQPLVTKSGQPTQRYFIAVAYSKTDPLFPAFYQKLVEVARGSFPHLFNAQGQCTHPRFSWKLADGDGMDDDGKPNANKPGFAGHWVVKFSSSYPPRCFHAGRYQPHEQIQDPKAIPRGYYVRVAGTIEGNDDASKPGLYVNLSMVELAGGQPSDIIVSGPDAGSIFGGTAAQLPPGVAAPVLPGTPGGMMPGAPMLGGQMPGGIPGRAPAGMPGQLPGAIPGQMPGMAPQPMAGGMPMMPGAAAPLGGMPAGALAVPGGLPNSPMGTGTPGASPAMTYPSSPAPGVAVQPNQAFLAGPGGVVGGAGMAAPGMPSLPAAPGVGAMPAAPSSVPQMTALAGGFTYEQFRQQGYTDEQLRAARYMV